MNTIQNRDINSLNPLVKVLVSFALDSIKGININPLVVEALRTKERQYILFCQGRTIKECLAKGVPLSIAEKYCEPIKNPVTWTLTSKHFEGRAIDIVPQRKINGKMTAIWNAKDKETIELIEVMRFYGFECGVDWKNTPDSPHFQITGSYTNVFESGNNNPYLTKFIQRELNRVVGTQLIIDGNWGKSTDEAISKFRKMKKYKSNKPMLGASALHDLVSSKGVCCYEY